MFQEKCFCTLKEIKVGSHEFSRKWKIVTDSFSWALGTEPKNIVTMGFEILGLVSELILNEHRSIMD